MDFLLTMRVYDIDLQELYDAGFSGVADYIESVLSDKVCADVLNVEVDHENRA